MILRNNRRTRHYKNHIGVTHPEIAKTLHPEKNIYRLEELMHGSDSKTVIWLCPDCQGTWSCTPFRRIYKHMNCPHCSVRPSIAKKSLGLLCSELLSEWDYEKNKNLNPFGIAYRSAQRVHWICQTCQHSWLASISSRTSQGSGCPICQRKRHQAYMKQLQLVIPTNNLSVTHPHLEVIWDTEKNHPLTFKHLSRGSQRITWWKCPHCHHSFTNRTFGVVNRKTPHVCKNCQQDMLNTPSVSDYSTFILTSA